MKIESLDQAIDFLRKKGYFVNRYNKVYMVAFGTSETAYPYTPRDLVKFAQSYTKEVIRGGKDVKEYQHRGNRAKTKQDITRECYENFSKNKSRYIENRWNWD